MYWFSYIIAPIIGGLIAASSFIVKKAPNAQNAINRLLPYKAFVGVGLLVLGVWNAIDVLPHLGATFKASALVGLTVVIVVAAELLLGFLLGMPQVAKWIPGDSAPEQKAVQLSGKLVPVEVPIGFLGIAAGALMMMWQLGIMA